MAKGPMMFLFNGSVHGERFQFGTAGEPCVIAAQAAASNHFVRVQVREQPSRENLPCGRMRVYYRSGQQDIRLSTLERLWDEQECESYCADYPA
jgi:hypothetical protein